MPIMTKTPDAWLPLSEPEFHVLLALGEADLHGYGIILAVGEATGGRVRLRTGTLYSALRRMEVRGWVEVSDERPEPADDDARRRYSRVTSHGRAVARAEAQRLASLADLARTRGFLPDAAANG
jgi:DNA-binding PadR family transcriptional regulator